MQSAYTTKIWRLRSSLGSHDNSPHVGLLYMLLQALIYIPVALVFNFVDIINVFIRYSQVSENMEWKIIGIYVAGFAVYMPFSIMYYRVGHKWG